MQILHLESKQDPDTRGKNQSHHGATKNMTLDMKFNAKISWTAQEIKIKRQFKSFGEHSRCNSKVALLDTNEDEGAREMAQQLRELSALLEGLSVVPRRHVRQLSTFCNSSSRGRTLLVSVGNCIYMYIHPPPKRLQLK